MSTETIDAAPVATEPTEPVQAVDAQGQPVVAQQDGESQDAADQPGTGEEKLSDTDKAIRRMQRRIDRLQGKTGGLQFERDQLREELAQLRQAREQEGETEQPQRKAADPVEIAQEIVRAKEFNEWCNTVARDGGKQHADFMDALKVLQAEVGVLVDAKNRPNKFMQTVYEAADKPIEVLYHLGKNPDVAEELSDLSPIRLAKRISKLEDEIEAKAKPKTSSAPKPLEAVKANGSGAKSLADMSDAEFAAKRRAQIAARR